MNCSPVYSAILLYLSILLIPAAEALAGPPDALPKSLTDSVLLLHSKSGSSCATGFLLGDGTLVTNSHVSNVLCPSGSCQKLQISRASGVGALADEPVSFTKAYIMKAIPVLDVTFLKLETDKPLTGYFDSASTALPGDPVYSLGFPKCGALTLSEGKVNSLENIEFSTTSRAAHGSSGSPLFTPAFKLIGVAKEAESLSGGFLSLFSDYTFETIALRADAALNMRNLSDDTLLLHQANSLITNYRDNIRTISGISRVRASISFLASVEGLRNSVLFSRGHEYESKVLAALAQYLDYLPYLAPETTNSELLQRLNILVLAYNLELKGPFQQFFVPVNTDAVFESLRRDFIPAALREDAQELIIFGVKSPYRGLELYGLSLGAQVAALAIIILAIFGFSVGYVFAGARGGFFRRSVWALSALLLWPLPIIAVWWQRRKRTSADRS